MSDGKGLRITASYNASQIPVQWAVSAGVEINDHRARTSHN